MYQLVWFLPPPKPFGAVNKSIQFKFKLKLNFVKHQQLIKTLVERRWSVAELLLLTLKSVCIDLTHCEIRGLFKENIMQICSMHKTLSAMAIKNN